MYYPKSSYRRSYSAEKKSILRKKPNEHAKIFLPPSWSGLVTVGEPSRPLARQQNNFSMGLWNINAQSDFRGVIFRNANPIQEIRPNRSCGTNKDALKSLKSLDNRLQREFQSSLLPDHDDYDDQNNPIRDKLQSTSSHVLRNEAKASQNRRGIVQHRGLIREFDVTRISPRAEKEVAESPVTYKNLMRQSSLSTISSFKLNFDGLDTSQHNSLKPPMHHRTSSIYSDYSDAHSLVSSAGSLMFTSYQSRKEAYEAIKSPRYAEEQIIEVSKLVRQLSDVEGRKRNERFEGDFVKLCDVANAVVQRMPATIMPFKLRKIEKDCSHETVGSFAFDFYLVAEIASEDFEVNFRADKPNVADVFLTGNNPTLELFSVADAITAKKKLSPCKLMIILAHIIKATDKETDVSSFPYGAEVSYEKVTEMEIQLAITFPGKIGRFLVNFVLAIDVDEFPGDTALRKNRQWPSTTVKHQVQRKGVHLTSNCNDIDLHSWSVAFLKSRRTLLQLTDETGSKLRLLLALQCLRETRFSNPDVILPAHFATILFWASIKYSAPVEWSTLRLGKRFIDLVVALRRCLWKRECLDFFVPNVNMFGKLSMEDCHSLSFKIDMLIKDPVPYLKSKLS